MKEESDFQNLDKYVVQTYNGQINYYWRSSALNKRSYKYYRVLPIFLGAFLTFASAISSTDYISSNQALRPIFAIGTPLVAVFLTITNELAKLSDWAADWRDKALTAQQLEMERDKYLATNPAERNPPKELEKIRRITIKETKSFFKRTENKNEVLSKGTDSDEN